MSEQKNNIDQMLNIGLGVGAIFAMSIKKYSYSYVIFTFLLGWNIMSNFVSGSGTTGMSPTKISYLFFSIILFFSTLYLTMITFKKSELFDRDVGSGDLPFYVKTSNLLILLVFFIVSLNAKIIKQLEDLMPNCGDAVMLLSLFLFTYLLGVMIVNISIIVNKKITDG
jgi:hypothetical protein|tara:strand:+ start:1951 stop:2454 length:504 start_codon:yes stop_codon:yes gene_type:complete